MRNELHARGLSPTKGDGTVFSASLIEESLRVVYISHRMDYRWHRRSRDPSRRWCGSWQYVETQVLMSLTFAF